MQCTKYSAVIEMERSFPKRKKKQRRNDLRLLLKSGAMKRMVWTLNKMDDQKGWRNMNEATLRCIILSKTCFWGNSSRITYVTYISFAMVVTISNEIIFKKSNEKKSFRLNREPANFNVAYYFQFFSFPTLHAVLYILRDTFSTSF